MESLDLISSKKIVENEIDIIQSRSLMTNVVKALHLYAPVYQEGRVHSVSAFIHSPIKIEVKNPDSIVETDKIIFPITIKMRTVALDKQHYIH